MSKREVGPIAKELIDAKARIVDPENWCQGALIFNGKRCALGAFSGSQGGMQGGMHKLSRSCAELFSTHTAGVNDYLGHAAIMQAFDHAIQRALNEGK